MTKKNNFLDNLKLKFFPKLNNGDRVHIDSFNPIEDSIPKILHQTFYTKELPAELQNNVTRLINLNPEWSYKIYDDSDIIEFIKSHYEPSVLKGFLSIDKKYGAARADLFRYLLMYKVGGVYLDIKASMDRSLSEVLNLDESFVLAQWTDTGQFKQWGTHYDLSHVPGGEFQQWHIVAKPGHPFLKAVIESVLANISKYNPSLHGTGKTGVIKVTGPVAYTAAIAPLLGLNAHRLIKDHREIGLFYSIYNNEADISVNEIHKISFKSHYSSLTESIIQLTWQKRVFSNLTAFLNCFHEFFINSSLYFTNIRKNFSEAKS